MIKMFGGLRTFLIGYHNPIVHSYYVIKAWHIIFNKYPNSREFICILFHDIGYIEQRKSNVNPEVDIHPILGAKICGSLFGKEYYNLCIAHSRDYAKKLNIPISKLCYADKYGAVLIPFKNHKIIHFFDSPEVTIDTVREFRKSCKIWCDKNIKNINREIHNA